MNNINKEIDSKKLNRYNEYITKLENLLKTIDIKGNYEQFRLAPCFMLFKFIDLLRSVAILDNHHMIASGNIITRSMFEVLVDFLYCETDRKNLYLRFGEYQYVNRVLLYNSSPKEIQSKVNQEDYKNITLPKHEEFIRKYNIKNKNMLYNWSGLSLSKRVNIVSKSIPELSNLYLNIYKVNCNYAHTYSDTICEYATLVNQKINIDYEQKYNKDKFLLIKEINSLVEIFYDNFKINYANKSLANIVF